MNEDDLLEPKFYADYPLWTICRVDLLQTTPESGGVAPFYPPNYAETGPLLLVFTDLDLVKRFIEDVHRKGIEPMAIGGPADLLEIATFFQTKGAKSIAIDFCLPQASAHYYPIEEITDSIRRGDNNG